MTPATPLPDLEKITFAVGPMARVAYGPAFIYPISAPAFVTKAKAERQRPPSSRLYLYAHIPFCNYACNFCYYVKRIGANQDQKESYVTALLKELDWVEPGTKLSQLFVGGGTPTALPPDLLERFLSGVMNRMRNDESETHTVEASPESLTEEHLEVLKQHGVGRVSMGIQTLREDVLATVRRNHSSQKALEACDMVVKAGLTLNVDLMYGLPGYSPEMFQADFRALAERGVHSVTAFNLRVNRNTPVSTILGDEDRLDLPRLLRWRALISETASSLGYVQTRWTTFIQPEGTGSDYSRSPAATDDGDGHQLGIGVSSRSHLGHVIYRNEKKIDSYVERIEAGESPVEEVLTFDEGDRKAYFISHTLGDGRPLNGAEYEQSFGTDFQAEFREPLERFLEAGLIEVSGAEILLTGTGKLVYDLITEAFYPQHAKQWLAERQDTLRTPSVPRAV